MHWASSLSTVAWRNGARDKEQGLGDMPQRAALWRASHPHHTGSLCFYLSRSASGNIIPPDRSFLCMCVNFFSSESCGLPHRSHPRQPFSEINIYLSYVIVVSKNQNALFCQYLRYCKIIGITVFSMEPPG